MFSDDNKNDKLVGSLNNYVSLIGTIDARCLLKMATILRRADIGKIYDMSLKQEEEISNVLGENIY